MASKLLLFHALAFFVVPKVESYSEFAEPLKLATPRSDGIYEFELIITEKLTMSTDGENGKVQVLDYDPDQYQSMPWYVRDSDQEKPCDATNSWNSSYYNLTSLLQLHGLHQVVHSVNGKVPGDPIVVPFGAEVILTVFNQLLSSVMTLHVHGLDKKGLWWADGVGFLQQCPIPPSTKYQYRFIADTPGTHWFHGHLGMDKGYGILGAFIVKKESAEKVQIKDESIVPNREYVMMLQDWTVASSNYIWYAQRWRTMKWQWGFDFEKLGRCWAPTRTYDFGAIGGVVALRTLLINEHGWHDQSDILQHPETLPLETFKVRKGEKILIRIINGASSHMMMLTIDDHKYTVVSADGYLIKAVETDLMIINPGERYDILIEGLSNPSRQMYPLIIETMKHFNKTGAKIEPFFGAAKIYYEDFEVSSKARTTALNPDWYHSRRCSSENRCLVLNCPFKQFPAEYNFNCKFASDFESLESPKDAEILSSNGFETGYEEYFINMHYDSHMNGWMYQMPRGIPYFHKQNLEEFAKPCDRKACPPESDARFDDACFCFYHLNITLGNIVQLVIYNMGYGGGYVNGYAHPFHIHGTHYYLLKMEFPEYNATNFVKEPNQDIDCEQTLHCNEKSFRNSSWLNGRIPDIDTKNPTFRDTVAVPMGGYVVIRFRADNPGWWFAHCHLMLHQMAGMAFAIKIGEHHQMPIPPPGFPNSCGDFDAPELDTRLKTGYPEFV